MKDELSKLRLCLYSNNKLYVEFYRWLLRSNSKKVNQYLQINSDIFKNESKEILDRVQTESLKEILDILIKHPQADYFWYNYDGELTWSEPDEYVEVPADSLRVDGEKIKALLRDIKINQLLC